MARKQLGAVSSGSTDDITAGGAQTLTNKTISGVSNAITNVTGTLIPAHASTYGGETFTIVGGKVTQIAGTTVGDLGYAPAINDRILILNAPASSGVGLSYSGTTQPANGMYVVTGNTTNLTLARSSDMSTSSPMSQTAWVNPFGGWGQSTLYQIATPSTNAAFTWNTSNVAWSPVLGTVAGLNAFSLTLSGWAIITGGLSATRITRRTTTITQSATPAINTDSTDVASITGLAQAITSMTTNLTGTPVAGDRLTIQITDNGTARAIAWGAKFEASTTPLPTTTTASTLLTVEFLWNAVTSKWCVQSANGTDTLVYRNSSDTLTNKTLTAPKIANTGYIADANGNEQIIFNTTASAVNELTVVNAATGSSPTIKATGGDTNIALNIQPKGSGYISLNNALGELAFAAYGPNGSVNYIQANGATTGNSPYVAALGSDPNISLDLYPQGTGKVRANGNPVLTSVTAVGAVSGTPSSSTYLRGDGQWAGVTIPSAGQAYDVLGFAQTLATRATGAGDNTLGIRIARNCSFTSVTFRCITADASGNLVVELRKNGTQVSGTSTSIAAASQVSGATTTGTWAFSAGDILTIYITGVGTTPGRGLTADITGVTT